MAKKLTPKQRKFADEYLATGNASEAYRRAYDCEKMAKGTIGRNAQSLLKHNLITAYLDSIQKPAQQKVAEAFQVNLESVTAMLLAVFQEAKAVAQFAPAATAAMGIAKLHGLVIDQTANTNTNYVMGIDRELTEGEFDEAFHVGVARATRSANRAH